MRGARDADYDMTNEEGDGWSDFEENKDSPAYYGAIDRDDTINFSNPSSRVTKFVITQHNNSLGSLCRVYCRKDSLEADGEGRGDQGPPRLQER